MSSFADLLLEQDEDAAAGCDDNHIEKSHTGKTLPETRKHRTSRE